MNSSGKVLTIFVVIIAILLISLTAISLFFFQKETERRKVAEATLEEFRGEKLKLEEDLKEIKKQNFLLQEKNKEADGRIDDLSDELELEKGLREEMKIEAAALQAQLEKMKSAKEEFDKEIGTKEEARKKVEADLEISQQKVKALEEQLAAEIKRARELNELYEQKQEEMSRLEKVSAGQGTKIQPALSAMYSEGERDYFADENLSGKVTSLGVELEEIVVVPGEMIDGEEIVTVADEALGVERMLALDRNSEGRILSVDIETEFVIVSLGEMDGVEIGDILSIFRDSDYVGDLRVTRLQPEMAAADLIPPFSIKDVKKNDQVKAK